MIKLLTLGFSIFLTSACSVAQDTDNTKPTDQNGSSKSESSGSGFHLNRNQGYYDYFDNLCKDYLENMNRVAPETGLYCGVENWFDERGKAAGFEEVEWQRVDIEEYRQALWNRYSASLEETGRYPPKEIREMFENEYMQRDFTLWKGRVNINNTGVVETVLRRVGSCAQNTKPRIFAITPEGSYDPEYGQGVYGEPFLYQGKTYLSSNSRASHRILAPFGNESGQHKKLQNGPEICVFEQDMEEQ